MTYFAILALLVIALFGTLYLVARLAKIERGKQLIVLLCLVPSIILFSIGIALLNISVEGTAEITVQNIDKLPDPGPVSFSRAMSFGFIPAAVYVPLSAMAYWLLGLHK